LKRMDHRELRNSLQELLGPLAEPVALTFRDDAPDGMERVGTAAPAGCAYWKLAASGMVFYTAAEDHLNCPIGAYTHGAELSSAVQAELEGTIGKMVGLHYLKMEEVPGIPRRNQPLRFVVYAPLSAAAGQPDVVLLRGNPRQIMLLTEAANAGGLMSPLPVLGRPACSVIPASIEGGKAAVSLGCIGNRVYAELPDGEFYLAVPGAALAGLVESLGSIVAANRELQQYHQSRCA
jgi:uncharacterized protein (DUF169 family)